MICVFIIALVGWNPKLAKRLTLRDLCLNSVSYLIDVVVIACRDKINIIEGDSLMVFCHGQTNP